MMLPVAILAGGKATRLYPATKTIPKSLIDVAGKPFVFHQLELLRRNGVKRVVICAGVFAGAIQQAVGDGSRFGLHVDFALDGPRLLGTGGAIKNALPLLGDFFFVLYGDSYLEASYSAVESAFVKNKKPGLMTVFKNCGRWDRSNIVFKSGRILEYNKAELSREMQYIDYGLGVFRAAAFDDVAPGEPCDLASVYQRLIANSQLTGLEVCKRFYEIGSPEGLMETRNYLETDERAKECKPNGKAPRSYAQKYLDDAGTILGRIDVNNVERVAELLVDLRTRGGRLFFLGVGGGAGHASHAVNDFRKIAGIEAYTPTDNVSELTARVNDDGWQTAFANWLRVSRLSSADMVFVFSVGGGDLARNISPNIVRALEYATEVKATVCGVVGRDGGYTAQIADACVIVPTADPDSITPHTEAFQAVVWHLLVSHPALQVKPMKWESVQ
jgi:D-sedoheptulose 7-phosphate isomerase